MNKFYQKKTITIIAASYATLMVAFLIFMALFNSPIADQYSFINEIRKNGILGYTGLMYSTWSGRLIQTLSLGVSYRLFGDFGAQIVLPIILLAMLCAAFAWIIYQLFQFREHKIGLSIIIGALLGGGTLYTTACLFDIYLWLDAAVVYLLGLVAIIYDLGLFIWIIKGNHLRHKIVFFILAAIAILLQTAGETSMVITVGWSFLAFLSTLFIKKWHQYRGRAFMLFALLLAGSLIMILAPGLWSRASYTEDTISLFGILVYHPLVAIKDIFLNIDIWRICLVVVIAIIIGSLIPQKVTTKELKYYGLISFLVLASFLYIPLVVFFYGSQSVGVESRALVVPYLGLFLVPTFYASLIVAFVLKKYSDNGYFKSLLIVIIVLSIVISILGLFDFNKTYITALVSRSNLTSERETLIWKYKNGEIEKLELPDAPIMISNSGATDFTSNGWVNVDWFYNSFIEYYGLNQDDVTIYGEKLVLPETKKDWYVERGRNDCVRNDSLIIYDKYKCDIVP